MPVDSKQIAAEVAKFKKKLGNSADIIAKLEKAYNDVLYENAGLTTEVKKLIGEITSWTMMIQNSLDNAKAFADDAKKISDDVEMIGRRYYEDHDALETMSEDFFAVDKLFQKDKNNKDLAKKREIAEKALAKASNNATKSAKEWGAVEATLLLLSKKEQQINLAQVEALSKDLNAFSKLLLDGPKMTKKMKEAGLMK